MGLIMIFDEFVATQKYVAGNEIIGRHYQYIDDNYKIYITATYRYRVKNIEYHVFDNLIDAEQYLYDLYRFIEDETNEN